VLNIGYVSEGIFFSSEVVITQEHKNGQTHVGVTSIAVFPLPMTSVSYLGKCNAFYDSAQLIIVRCISDSI
jgi:hypothetical protein